MNGMLSSVVFALLFASVLGGASQYSYSPAKGSGGGVETTLTGKGPITGVRMWSAYHSYVYGIQLRFGPIWSKVVGWQSGQVQEMELFDDETIVQVSGKYGHYIQQLIFVTSRGRFLMAGQPAYHSFSMFPAHKDAQLVFLSVRVHGALTAVGAHWAVMDRNTM